MNKKVITAVVIVLVLLLGGFLYMRKGSSLVAPQVQTANQTPVNPATTLRDLISKGIAQSCTFTANNTQGTVYVAGNKVRGDFNSTIDGKVTASHMIVDSNTSYLWMDGTSRGIKMSFDPNAQPSATPGASGSFDAAATMNYKCSAWITDASKFTFPAGVTFTAFSLPSAAPAKTTGTSGGSNSSQCSYCDSLSGDAKAQCMSALNCK